MFSIMVKGKTRRLTKKRRSQTRMKGGGLDCEEEGFNKEMREASFGMEYKIYVAPIHYDGEKWTYERLVYFSNEGILDWYARKLGKTAAEFEAIKRIPELQILGAFFHRYKIVAEQLGILRNILERGVKTIFRLVTRSTLNGANSFSRYIVEFPAASPEVRAHLTTLARIRENADFLGILKAKDLPYEMAIDRAQCLMFYIVKHGRLPEGFVMDDRVRRRAEERILVNVDNERDLRSDTPLYKLRGAIAWINFQNEAYAELNEPPVTFGVF